MRKGGEVCFSQVFRDGRGKTSYLTREWRCVLSCLYLLHLNPVLTSLWPALKSISWTICLQVPLES